MSWNQGDENKTTKRGQVCINLTPAQRAIKSRYEFIAVGIPVGVGDCAPGYAPEPA